MRTEISKTDDIVIKRRVMFSFEFSRYNVSLQVKCNGTIVLGARQKFDTIEKTHWMNNFLLLWRLFGFALL